MKTVLYEVQPREDKDTTEFNGQSIVFVDTDKVRCHTIKLNILTSYIESNSNRLQY